MSLYSVVSRGMVGRLGQRPAERDSTVAKTQAVELDAGDEPDVRLPGASMRFLETGLALVSIATAILIGAGR